MTAACFVDANVFVYSRDQAEVRKREIAMHLLDTLWREQSGRTSTQALNEFYVTVTRKKSFSVLPADAWQVVEETLQWNPQAMDSALLLRSRTIQARHNLSWWDSMIVAAAQMQDCATLYTEDLQHGSIFDGVRVCNPFIAQVQEQPPREYSPVRMAGHRPRGRPRKAA
jgi:predicted nucleic acid-binding protein